MKNSVYLKKKPKKFRKSVKKSTDTIKVPIIKPDKSRFYLNRLFSLFLYIVPIVFFLLFLVFYFLNWRIAEQIQAQQLISSNFEVKPEKHVLLGNIDVPIITAQSAIITDVETGKELYSKNANIRFSIASITKLMTTLVGLEYFKEDSVLTISTPRVEGSNLGFVKGDRFYFLDMVYAMLLPSSNEAAYAIADNYPGGLSAFVRRMNEKAYEFGLRNTRFGDPAGLDDDNNYSDVADMATLASYAIRNDVIKNVVVKKDMAIVDIDGRNKYRLKNLNRLLGVGGVKGLKTGTTEGAGEVLMTLLEHDGRDYVIIVMRSSQRFSDTQILMSVINDNVYVIEPVNF